MAPIVASGRPSGSSGHAAHAKVLVLAGMIGIACVFFGLALRTSRQLGELTIEPPAADLGIVQALSEQSFSFRLSNQTGETVIIDSVTASCDCASPTLGDMHLVSGAETLLNAQWTAPAVPGLAHTGIKVTYRFEGTDTPIIQWLEIRGNVAPPSYVSAPSERGVAHAP